MKMKKLFLLSGPPACGKSSFAKKNLGINDEWISRDNVRFAIIGENEDYFSHEEEVFETFVCYINQMLEKSEVENIYIDATHLNKASRNKVIKKIKKDNVNEINCVIFQVPLGVCLERNESREGRTKVPKSVIRRMYYSHTMPEEDEKFDNIIIVDEYLRSNLYNT